MAPYNQNGPPGFGSVGRGGYKNNGRGKKGRGAYHGQGNGSHFGVASSYGNNWGPRIVPDMQNDGNTFPPGPTAPWGNQYGGYPGAHPGLWVPPAVGYPLPAATNLSQPRAVSDGFAPQIPSYDSTPTYHTPIATPTMPFTKPATQRPVSAAANKTELPPEEQLVDSNAPTTVQPDAVQQSQTSSHHSSARILAGTQPFEPVDAPISAHVSTLSLNPLDATDATTILDNSKEGQLLLIDAPFKTPESTIKLLELQSLQQLQQLNRATAADFQRTLLEARRAYQTQLAAFDDQRAKLLDLLKAALDCEIAHDKNVRRLYDKFILKMKLACKEGGAGKDAAQLEAISILNAAKQESSMALQRRETLEKCRRELLMLDNERIVTANIFANAVHGVVFNALRRSPLAAVATSTSPENDIVRQNIDDVMDHIVQADANVLQGKRGKEFSGVSSELSMVSREKNDTKHHGKGGLNSRTVKDASAFTFNGASIPKKVDSKEDEVATKDAGRKDSKAQESKVNKAADSNGSAHKTSTEQSPAKPPAANDEGGQKTKDQTTAKPQPNTTSTNEHGSKRKKKGSKKNGSSDDNDGADGKTNNGTSSTAAKNTPASSETRKGG
ncbi:hypothetical protein EK21DRAFT_87762 [Setomelanomma holmii]|uniref:Uncharacterized protein n=1 Tax=Setomelanomma holmii TaxID=210430 RepID=A0A9P4LLN2_9PLEO|nr:hypothetical protein EK21DRAFT_87762 [Setomelanomma holmii]